MSRENRSAMRLLPWPLPWEKVADRPDEGLFLSKGDKQNQDC
jgi:hypothetical protein